MNPSQITKKSLVKWGGESVYVQAEQLVRRGAVLKADMKDDWISGVIARESASEINTKLRVLDPDRIESRCPCFTNQHSGQVCPHVVALGIALMLRHADPLREQKYQEEQRRARRLEQLDESAYLQRGPRAWLLAHSQQRRHGALRRDQPLLQPRVPGRVRRRR